MKKIISLSLLLIGIFTLTACTEKVDITLDLNEVEITLIETETFKINPTTNDEEGLVYNSQDESIATVSDNGEVTALSEGLTIVEVVSVSDESVSKTLEVTVRKKINLVSSELLLTMIENETYQLNITSNDEVTYQSSNPDILVVDTEGLMTAKEEGNAYITVTSVYDEEVTLTINVTIEKLSTLDLLKDHYVLVVGDTELLSIESTDQLTYLSGDNSIVTVSENGVLTATGFGETFVRISSTLDEALTETVTVKVYKRTEEISIEGAELLINGLTTLFDISASPVGSLPDVIWESSDESILSVDELGNVTAKGSGSAVITAISTIDATIADTLNVEVINLVVVDQSKAVGDTYNYEGVELEYGIHLFSTISEALEQSTDNTIIQVNEGSYDENIYVQLNNVSFVSEGLVELSGRFTTEGNNISIDGFTFVGGAIVGTDTEGREGEHLSGFTFINNQVNLTEFVPAFIDFAAMNNITISDNVIDSGDSIAIRIDSFLSSTVLIESNVINSNGTAIRISSDGYDASTEVKIMFNEITADTAFYVNMYESQNTVIFATARFNNVTASNMNVVANEGSTFDFTLNHWENFEDLQMDKFMNVDPYYLAGHYPDCREMKTKSTYDPTLPTKIIVTNPIDEIMVGDNHTFEYQILPYELSEARVRFITGNPDLVSITQEGTISPITSGQTYIQVRSYYVSSIRVQTNFSIITTPGIELIPSQSNTALMIGDTFSFDTVLFPYTIEEETSTIVSSDPSIASIDASGLVTTHDEGEVTFTATLDSDPSVSTSYTIQVFDDLDETKLLDYLTLNQLNYAQIYKWTAYGFQYNYKDSRAASVSKYYFDELVINQDKIVPVSYGIRPGEPMEDLPVGIEGFNDDNIYWVVVHDTGSTGTGSGALSHANYLYNAALEGTELWVSWHYTIDDTEIYQHLPETERGYHAGDGSTRPGEGSYLGGGNRNGIGIEMAINDDGDLFRTWQRNAKLVTDILVRNSLPITQMRYHYDFSGKNCPQTLRGAQLVPMFEEFVAVEYHIRTIHPNAVIEFESHNPDLLDNHGRILFIPDRATQVSYTITVTDNGVTESRTFYTYVPGAAR